MAQTKYAFLLQKEYEGDTEARKPSSVSFFANSYEEGLAQARALAARRSKGKRRVTVIEDSGRKGTFKTVRGVGAGGARAKKSGYQYEGDKRFDFSEKLKKEYGGLTNVDKFPMKPASSSQGAGIITDTYGTGNQYILGPDGTYIPYVASTLSQAGAPSNAANVAGGFGTPTLPNATPSSGNISGASAAATGANTMLDLLMKQQEDYQAQADKLQAAQQKQASSFLSGLLKKDSSAEVRENAYGEIGVNPKEFFAEERARIDEIGALTEEYNAIKAAKDAQIAATYDTMSTNNFINNRIAQIERNAAPKLNQLSANINAKAAVLQALQGSFAEAREYVSQAVEDATADTKFQLDLFTTFYQVNQDAIDRLDQKHQTAFAQAFELAKFQWQNEVDEKTQVGELLISNPQAGISIYDSLEEAYRKIGVNPESPDYLYKMAQIENIYADNARLGRDGSGGTSGFKNADVESDVRADASALLDQVNAEGSTFTLAMAYKKLRLLYSTSEATDDAIRSLLGYFPTYSTSALSPLKSGPMSTLSSTKTTTSSSPYSGSTQSSLSGLMEDYNPFTLDSISSFLFK